MSENLFEKPQSEESAEAAAYEAYEEALEAEAESDAAKKPEQVS